MDAEAAARKIWRRDGKESQQAASEAFPLNSELQSSKRSPKIRPESFPGGRQAFRRGSKPGE
jgi:hypothetical protein